MQVCQHILTCFAFPVRAQHHLAGKVQKGAGTGGHQFASGQGHVNRVAAKDPVGQQVHERTTFKVIAGREPGQRRHPCAADGCRKKRLVALLNLVRPSTWDEVSDWLDRERAITNSKLREISGLDTLAASKQLKNWVSQGVLVALPAASRQHASYTKPELLAMPADSLSKAGFLKGKPGILFLTSRQRKQQENEALGRPGCPAKRFHHQYPSALDNEIEND